MLHRRPDRLLTVERGGEVVRKSFLNADHELARRAAADEYRRLERFWAALGPVPGVACPRPIEVVTEAVPALRMERVWGTPLLSLLQSPHLDEQLPGQLAAAAALALLTYVEAVGEAYHDFQFDNMMYDAALRRLVLLDFGVADDAGTAPAELTALEASLGNLIGSTIFQSARPKWLFQPRQHRRAVRLSIAIVHQVAASAGEAVSGASVHWWGQRVYQRCAFGGGRGRRAWYATGGYLIARRVRIADITFTPVR